MRSGRLPPVRVCAKLPDDLSPAAGAGVRIHGWWLSRYKQPREERHGARLPRWHRSVLLRLALLVERLPQVPLCHKKAACRNPPAVRCRTSGNSLDRQPTPDHGDQEQAAQLLPVLEEVPGDLPPAGHSDLVLPANPGQRRVSHQPGQDYSHCPPGDQGDRREDQAGVWPPGHHLTGGERQSGEAPRPLGGV